MLTYAIASMVKSGIELPGFFLLVSIGCDTAMVVSIAAAFGGGFR